MLSLLATQPNQQHTVLFLHDALTHPTPCVCAWLLLIPAGSPQAQGPIRSAQGPIYVS